MMDLIERYLGAVRWNLPAGKAEDILAELRDLIAARVEDREEALGRALRRDEVSALLKDFGHPIAVAGQYREQQALIGTEAFPFYWFALRVLLAVVAIIELIQIGGSVIVGRGLGQALTSGMADAFHALLFHAALITLLFAVIERTGWLTRYLARWKPEELPELRAAPRRPLGSSRWESVFGIACGIAFLAWWSGAFVLPLTPRDGGVELHAAPVWTSLYWPVVLLVWAQIVQSLVTLAQPGWKALRALLVVGVAAGTVAIAAMLRHAGRLVMVAATDPGHAARIQEGLDQAFTIAVVIVPIVAIVQGAVELWKLYRR